MQLQTISLLTTPLVTGFVGYFTNYLAIKMLFRPHRRRWYSAGWQGVIPKNRKKIAGEVANLVGKELIREDDIRSALQSENFQNLLSYTVSEEVKNFLQRDYGSLYEIMDNFGLDIDDVINRTVLNTTANDQAVTVINDLLQRVAREILDSFLLKSVSEIEGMEDKISYFVRKIMSRGNWQELLIDEIFAKLNNTVYSGNSLQDILPEELLNKKTAISKQLTDKGIAILKKLLNDEKTKKVIIQKFIELKNNYFGSGFFDQLKLGMLNVFLNEDAITEIVNDELPKIINAISENDEIIAKLEQSVENYIDQALQKPFYEIVEMIGPKTFYKIRMDFNSWLKSYLRSDELINKVESYFVSNYHKYSGFTFGGILKTAGVDPYELLSNSIDIRVILSESKSSSAALTDGIVSILKDIRVSEIYNKIPEPTFEQLKITLTYKINEILDKHIINVLGAINLTSIVEEKVNSLDLNQLENLLFSFMRDQFRWINILGFILGFIFGAIQSLLFYLY